MTPRQAKNENYFVTPIDDFNLIKNQNVFRFINYYFSLFPMPNKHKNSRHAYACGNEKIRVMSRSL